MKMYMKKYLFMFVLTLLPGVVNAEVVEINGIYYDLLLDELEAEVTSSPYRYSGKIIIPQTVMHEGITYKVTSIGSDAFYDCLGLTAVNIPEGVEYIRSKSFCRCENLTSINIPNSVRIIAVWAFSGCYSLTSVSLGNGLTAIGDRAFDSCINLASIKIPDNVTAMGILCFNYCQNLTSVTLGNNIKTIKEGTFEDCKNLKTINIPNSVTLIETRAFSGCESLESIVLPNGLTTIGYQAFSGSGLIELTIPSSVTNLGAFDNSTNRTGYAFCYCKNLERVIIGDGVSHIPSGTFYFCDKLNKVTFGKNVTRINEEAFGNCANLSSIAIPDYVTYIGKSAFNGCHHLKKLTIGRGVTLIEEMAFSGCERLQDVFCYAENPPKVKGKFHHDEFPTLHVPGSSINVYSSTSPWNEFHIIMALNNDSQKCEIPEIRYENGELKFSCATSGAEFAYQITDDDIKSGYESSVKLDATYHISVYATRNGYENSDVATATLCWIEAEPKQEGIANKIAEIKSYPVLIQNIGGTISITGIEDNTPISVFSTSGMKVGSAVSGKGKNVIETSLRRGETAIVKIGEQSFKVLIK